MDYIYKCPHGKIYKNELETKEKFFKIELPFKDGNMYLNFDVEENIHLDSKHATKFTFGEICNDPILKVFKEYAKAVE
ncbi:hypothetical protein ACYSNU_17735 [Enterococcus sp. LJL120]